MVFWFVLIFFHFLTLGLIFNRWLPEIIKSEFHPFDLEIANFRATGMGEDHSRVMSSKTAVMPSFQRM